MPPKSNPILGFAPKRRAGAPPPLVFILGPCVIESERMIQRHAAKIAAICGELGVNWVLKASYDKANRTSGKSFRAALNPREACALLAMLGQEHEVRRLGDGSVRVRTKQSGTGRAHGCSPGEGDS